MCLITSAVQTAYYDSTKASRFIRAGFSPAIVNMALAYNAANRGGDESQVRAIRGASPSAVLQVGHMLTRC